ncbi:MAG: 4Fe-4S binding protein, partial [Geobacteraceae bacterium]
MGHLVGKDIFRELGRKIDSLETRAPWNDTLHAILKELYSELEAELVVKMPHGLSTIEQLERSTGYESVTLLRTLDGLTAKGLVMDLCINDRYYYAVSPLVIGIFEFTMMRTGPSANSKVWAKLLHAYLLEDDAFMAANFGNGDQVTLMRALPHQEAVSSAEFLEILDYEKASELLEQTDRFAIGLCSCRHEKHHLGSKECDIPLETCSSFGTAADFMIRNNLAREVSRSKMAENFARSRELGLVFNVDNVRRNMKFLCHCCKCCCVPLLGISKFGYANAIVTSTYLAEIFTDQCIGCGKCAKACPIDAIELQALEKTGGRTKKEARVDASICIGCGVCALQCPTKGCLLAKRKQRVIHPETTFERLMLQCLEKGTLQNQIFADPKNLSEKFLRSFVGGFLRLSPVKKALMS